MYLTSYCVKSNCTTGHPFGSREPAVVEGDRKVQRLTPARIAARTRDCTAVQHDGGQASARHADAPSGASLVELVRGRALNNVHQPARSRLLLSTSMYRGL